jgi:hypothetical protein
MQFELFTEETGPAGDRAVTRRLPVNAGPVDLTSAPDSTAQQSTLATPQRCGTALPCLALHRSALTHPRCRARLLARCILR